MNKVFLSINDILLGYLCEGKDCYIFYADKENINLAKKQYSLKMKFFMLNTSGLKHYENIPFHYSEYIENIDREDLVESAGIKDDDSIFTKLYKLAGIKLKPINFGISQG